MGEPTDRGDKLCLAMTKDMDIVLMTLTPDDDVRSEVDVTDDAVRLVIGHLLYGHGSCRTYELEDPFTGRPIKLTLTAEGEDDDTETEGFYAPGSTACN